jgi:virulence factor
MSEQSTVKEKVRIAVIGAGQLANRVHYPSLTSFSDVEIVGICDLDEQRLRETADTYHIQNRYTSYQRMIEECAPDGVYAIGQPHIMFDIWLWCLQQGQNLYIEKPMGITWHQAQLLSHLAEQKGIITQVSHQRRSSPMLVKLHEECLKQGPITHAVCEFYKYSQEPFFNARDHMLDDCTHAIDTLRYMCGGEVTAIESHCKRIGVPDINWIGAQIHFDNGSTGYLINSWSSGKRVFRVQMHAPGIFVDADVEGEARLYKHGDLEGKVYHAQEEAGGDQFYIYGGFQAKSREFIDSLKYGKEVTTSPFRDCLKTMEVAEKILARALQAGE